METLSPIERHLKRSFETNNWKLSREQIDSSLLDFRKGKTGRPAKVVLHYMKKKLKPDYYIEFDSGIYSFKEVGRENDEKREVGSLVG
jgi:hypothetical protein